MFRPTASRIFLIRFAVLLLLTFMFANIGAAQPGPMEQPDLTIDAATRTKVIDGILKRLNDSYVFPEVAKKMEQSIRERVDKKEYDQVRIAKEVETKQNDKLQAESNEKLLRRACTDTSGSCSW